MDRPPAVRITPSFLALPTADITDVAPVLAEGQTQGRMIVGDGLQFWDQGRVKEGIIGSVNNQGRFMELRQ